MQVHQGQQVTPCKKGYKFRLYPTPEQKQHIAKTMGCCRFVYNHLLDTYTKAHQAYKESLVTTNPLPKPIVNWVSLANQIPHLKAHPDKEWLREVSSVALQQSVKALGRAFLNFFSNPKKFKYPRFKKKHNHQSFSLGSNAFSIQGDQFTIAKCPGSIKIILSRELPSQPTSVTISVTPSGEYYASFICEYYPTPKTGQGTLGVDLGISSYLTASDGTVVPNPKNYTKYQRRMRRLQQSLSRKQKGSSNRNKARIRLAKIHQKITNTTQDFLHKLSTTLVSENQALGVEGLRISNMVKNHHLARSIQEASWGKFLSYLKYKARESFNCTLVVMDPFYPSSRLCSCCGYYNKHLKLKDRVWTCPTCTTIHDRDYNASVNIWKVAVDTKLGWSQEGSVVYVDRRGENRTGRCPWVGS